MASGNTSVEAACASLVREYLSRKGLKGTLQKMDEECPRNEFSINNRQALMKHVHLEKFMKRNKEDTEPFQAMLEVMTKHFMEQKPHHLSEQQLNTGEANRNHVSRIYSDTNFSPQANHPADQPTKSLVRPGTAAPGAKREKISIDLIIDDDVEGETIVGSGRKGLMELEMAESPPQLATRAQPSRPVSAKQGGGTIFSNSDAFLMRRRSQPVKSSKITQQEKQKKNSTPHENSFLGLGEFQNDEGVIKNGSCAKSSNSYDLEIPSVSSFNRKKSPNSEDPPVSFEALLQKGAERAHFLNMKGQKTENSHISSQMYKVENSSMMDEKSRSRQRKENGDFPMQNYAKMADLELGEVEDVDFSLRDVELKPAALMVQKPLKLTKFQPSPIDLKTAIALKNIVLGSPTQQYTDEWLHQSYTFCDIIDIKYGLVQNKGGPCGVLAAVQACLLQEMLFGKNALPAARYKNPSRAERSKALAIALSNIFWRAGDYSRAVVTTISQTTHVLSSTKFKQDNVTEKLSLYTFTNFDELSSFLLQSVAQFESDGSPGVILTVYSAILSRKCHQVRADFDVPEQTTLIGSHGYCSQELVNLLLTSRAVSNVFNDIVQLESGGIGQTVTLKGISGRSDIGFLSLFEHYQSCQVGTYYKTPKNPIWVVCSESHFSVLFSLRKDLLNDWKVERRFDLIYYDGLARQEGEIKLTISTTDQSYKPAESEDDLVPPLEHCIRTKWPDAEIDWNGYDPIL